jgi:NAD+ synthase (glutamine-hydrolysing)
MQLKKKLTAFGFVRVGTAVPRMKVGDPVYNAERTIELMERAEAEGANVVAFPELGLTGYTCADLFHQRELRDAALEALIKIKRHTWDRQMNCVFIVGLPLEVDGMLFNCAAVVHKGYILGIVPKSYLPGYKEFYEPRWFRRANAARSKQLSIDTYTVPFGTDLLFQASDMPEFIFGVEICEDVWSQVPPSVRQTMAGALIGFNLSASNERIGKAHYRRTQLVPAHSAANLCAYAYVSAGVDESTTDIVFSGHMLIAVNGDLVAENKRFERNAEGVLLLHDVDTEKLLYERLINNTYADCQADYAANGWLDFRTVHFRSAKEAAPAKLVGYVEAHPFVPRGEDALRERCEEIDNIQVTALCQRLKSAGVRKSTIGVSGGLDSTRALQVVVQAYDRLGLPRTEIHGFTMPGYGTTARTKGNAHELMEQTGITAHEVDIRAMCFEQWRSERYKPFGIDLEEVVATVRRRHLQGLIDSGRALQPEDLDVDFTALAVEEFQERLRDLPPGAQDLRFENTQARMRTKILMDNGFVIGTGDLSEAALGWCTYNGDHMSMYNVNCSVPKTLIKFLVRWSALNQFDGEARETLLDIFNTEISPELLPTSRKGETHQKTEKVVGPYELTDFFLYHMLRFGMGPQKILYLAQQARFDVEYSDAELRQWLRTFYKRFFGSQFKRSCVPDGPKVGSVSLSPRGDWRMPSDASMNAWISWLDSEIERDKENATMTTSSTAPATAGATTEIVRAHVIVDAINDFGSDTHTDGGQNKALLPVPEGEQVGPAIGRLQTGVKYKTQVAGNDTHPFDMFNFLEVAGNVPTVKDANGNDAPVFPRHCVKGTWGCDFLPGIDPKLVDRIFPKGDQPNLDSFSACGNQDLVPYLREQGVTDVDVDGLVFRICVGSTALDLADAGFRVRVITDATRDLAIDAFQSVIDKMKAHKNITFCTVDEAIALG